MPARDLERRGFRIELRANGADGDHPVLEGYAAVFNELSEDLGGFVEQIAPGAFAEALGEGADVRAFWNHNSDLVLGRQSAGTLDLAEDEHGLRFTARPPAATWVSDKLLSVERGDVDQASFLFVTERDTWRDDPELGRVRTLEKIKPLIEVSAGVALPAYTQTHVDTRVAQRSLEQALAGGELQAPPDNEATPIARMLRRQRLRYLDDLGV